MGWNNALSYKGFGFSFLINGRFGGVVTSSTEAILDRFGVSKRSAEARDAGGALFPGSKGALQYNIHGLLAMKETVTSFSTLANHLSGIV